MNLFQFVEDVEMGKFLVSAMHDNCKVIALSIYPIVDGLVYPTLLMELDSSQPLIKKIEDKLTGQNEP